MTKGTSVLDNPNIPAMIKATVNSKGVTFTLGVPQIHAPRMNTRVSIKIVTESFVSIELGYPWHEALELAQNRAEVT